MSTPKVPMDESLFFLFLLNDCHKLIEESIDEEIILESFDIEQRKGMLKCLDEAIIIMQQKLPKFTIEEKSTS